ncbi:hypothetical protein [Compostimonas suwonensis]|uniref:Uncharacterized protein n=1 Tax=Compostimonas suwonensis TaxID=1048394 RepID=A0A2M9C3W4_9MICO|nr:hypothetical protein [Compostimonas suwonensis]PJJ65202.1 hypothetical protein CLV54_0231 [Compostimonas suwonensis]
MSAGDQTEPVQDGSGDATQMERIRGLLVQVTADMAGHSDEQFLDELRRRLDDTGIEVSDQTLGVLLEAARGSSSAP